MGTSTSSEPASSFESLSFVIYNPKNKWHMFEPLNKSMNDKYWWFTIYEPFNYNKILLGKNNQNIRSKQVQLTYENRRFRGSTLKQALAVDRDIKNEINHSSCNKGWVKIENDANLVDIAFYDLKFYEDPSLEDTIENMSYIQLVNYLKLDLSKVYLFKELYYDPNTKIDDKFKLERKYNENLDSLTDPLTFEPKEYPFHLAHAVPSNAFPDIIKSGKICIDQRCLEVYDESTGIFLGNTTEYDQNQFPGIYMELFQHSRIAPFTPPMELSSDFTHFRSLTVDSYAALIYGDVGFIYPFEEIFDNYRVSLKKNFNMGMGESITLDEYVNNFGGECVVRSNSLNLDKFAALYIKFTFTEIDFIHDKLIKGKDVSPTLEDVAKLYLTFKRNGKSPWFVRKSAFKQVLLGYKINSIRSKNLTNLPKIYAVTPGRGYSNNGASVYNDPDMDVESDFDSFDPNVSLD